MKTTSADTLNIPAARGVLDYLVAHPEEHDQLYYVSMCRTRRCIAGTACWLDPDTTFSIDEQGYVSEDVWALGWGWSFPSRARKILGLSIDDAEMLFFSLMKNSEALDYLRTLIAEAEAVQNGSVPALSATLTHEKH